MADRERPRPPYDLARATADLAAADPSLQRWIEEIGPCRLEVRPRPLFQALLRSVVYQQLSGTAASTIHGRVLDHFGGRVPTPSEFLSASEEALRSCGLSAAKRRTLTSLAEKMRAGTLPDETALREMSDEAVLQALTVVWGIGPWTVQMVLIFTLGRPDVLPATDLGVRAGIKRVDGLDAYPSPGEVRARGEAWSPWRSVATWYLWQAAG